MINNSSPVRQLNKRGRANISDLAISARHARPARTRASSPNKRARSLINARVCCAGDTCRIGFPVVAARRGGVIEVMRGVPGVPSVVRSEMRGRRGLDTSAAYRCGLEPDVPPSGVPVLALASARRSSEFNIGRRLGV